MDRVEYGHGQGSFVLYDFRMLEKLEYHSPPVPTFVNASQNNKSLEQYRLALTLV